MGLKADNWIRKMALEQGMIEPFVDGQVREGVISYGLSSYGYDVRVTDEFKIFTNVHSAMVDPKHFVKESFVDFKGDVCVIPPNSFVLARTVEYFRIPSNVLTICLGKSTYARCFRGDTRVALVDGTAPTLEEMAKRGEAGEMFWGYSIGENGRMIVTLLEKPRYIGRDALVEVVLDNDESIFCTPDHLFMLRDGRWVAAGDLRPQDSLMPLYRDLHRGYEMVYQPLNGHLYPTHRMADEWNVRHEVYANEPDTHRHHIDHERRNNNPWNLTRMLASEHIRYHNELNYGEDFDPDEHSESIKVALAERMADPAWRERYAQLQRAARYLDCDRSVFRRFPEVLDSFRGLTDSRNHKVTAVRDVAGTHDVYCLTVPEAGNFALESGVFVHNCGLIVNVTPFEPGWEGYVTLEISNTTPLPAKIYAYEGISQVLFFEGDEPCDTTYADRKGKYQNQQSIVLPRI